MFGIKSKLVINEEQLATEICFLNVNCHAKIKEKKFKKSFQNQNKENLTSNIFLFFLILKSSYNSYSFLSYLFKLDCKKKHIFLFFSFEFKMNIDCSFSEKNNKVLIFLKIKTNSVLHLNTTMSVTNDGYQQHDIFLCLQSRDVIN